MDFCNFYNDTYCDNFYGLYAISFYINFIKMEKKSDKF